MILITPLFFKWMLSTAGLFQIGLAIGAVLFVKLTINIIRVARLRLDFRYWICESGANAVLAIIMVAFLLLGFIQSIMPELSLLDNIGEWLDRLFTKNK